jgi:membrane protein YdbS with pleckstrin-like domain
MHNFGRKIRRATVPILILVVLTLDMWIDWTYTIPNRPLPAWTETTVWVVLCILALVVWPVVEIRTWRADRRRQAQDQRELKRELDMELGPERDDD